jgi:hypothetical protein
MLRRSEVCAMLGRSQNIGGASEVVHLEFCCKTWELISHRKPGLRLARVDLALAIVIRAEPRFFVLGLMALCALALNICDLFRAWGSIDEKYDVTAY